jgi:hypothetical protein
MVKTGSTNVNNGQSLKVGTHQFFKLAKIDRKCSPNGSYPEEYVHSGLEQFKTVAEVSYEGGRRLLYCHVYPSDLLPLGSDGDNTAAIELLQKPDTKVIKGSFDPIRHSVHFPGYILLGEVDRYCVAFLTEDDPDWKEWAE